MTATADKLPDFEGTPVHKAAIKFSGAGTGLSEGLAVQPIALHQGNRTFFVIETECVNVAHPQDKDGYLTRLHHLNVAHTAPISDELAQKVIREYAAEVEKAKAQVEGQEQLFAEQAAAEREAKDGTATPAEIAADAAKRAKGE